jgi:hypothetical protein
MVATKRFLRSWDTECISFLWVHSEFEYHSFISSYNGNELSFGREPDPIGENTLKKGAQTRTPQKDNNAEQRKSFILKRTHFNMNNDM